MTTVERTLTGPRASSLAMCERRPYYEAIGAAREDVHPRQERIFRRGRRIGIMLAQEIAETYAEQDIRVEVEREVPWPTLDPIGVGHADLFIPDDAHTIEIVSTAGADLPRHKALQAAFYSIHDPASQYATVLSIDPSTNEEKAYPVEVEGMRDELDERVERVVHALKGGMIPRRALRNDGDQVETPHEWPCFDCPFRRTCWAEWEPAPAGVLPDHLHPLVAELAGIEDRLAKVKALPDLEARRDEIRGLLRGHLREKADYRIPGFKKIRVSPVAGRRTFALKRFEDAGHTLPALAEEFVSTGQGHDRWTLTREEDLAR